MKMHSLAKTDLKVWRNAARDKAADLHRHCEPRQIAKRFADSEAIQGHKERVDCFVAFGVAEGFLAMTTDVSCANISDRST